MTDREFDRQYDAATVRGEFGQAVDKFVTDDVTALAALQELHERLRELSAPHDCPQHLYYLSSDVRDLIGNALEYYKEDADEDVEFEDDEEIRQLAETI